MVLILATRGYFTSRNCLRELTAAVKAKKPLICVVEGEKSHGGMSFDEIRAELKDHVPMILNDELVPELADDGDVGGATLRYGRRRASSVQRASSMRVRKWHVVVSDVFSKGQELCTLE